MKSVCIIDDDPEIRDTIVSLTRKLHLLSETAPSLSAGLELLGRESFDVLFLDVRLPDGNGLAALPEIKRLPDAPEVIILTGIGDPDGAELAIQEGVWDYLVKPSPLGQIMLTLQRALRYREEKRCDRAPVSLSLAGCVAASPRMRPCLDLVAHAAWSSAAVLITGETGTGKELFARLIHANSTRAKGPFVAVDCAALTETLVESTLFGHVKGAFTGAETDRVGLVRLANGGTLFLDEVGEMPLSLQKTFLRVLHEKRFRPVGATAEMESDFRLVAATNRDLEPMIERGEFRRDLYFRLKTIALHLPPLRARPEDIKPLTLSIVDGLSAAYERPAKGFDADFLASLEAHDWPGNVRELENLVERVAVMANGPVIGRADLPEEFRRVGPAGARGGPLAVERESGSGAGETRSGADGEARPLLAALGAAGGNVRAAAKALGVSRVTLYARIRRLGLCLEDFRRGGQGGPAVGAEP